MLCQVITAKQLMSLGFFFVFILKGLEHPKEIWYWLSPDKDDEDEDEDEEEEEDEEHNLSVCSDPILSNILQLYIQFKLR